MSDKDRADGFWWVRIYPTTRWYVGEVHDNELTYDQQAPGVESGACWRVDADIEWGPYLGSEPKSDAKDSMVFGYRVTESTKGDFLAEFIDFDRKMVQAAGFADSHADAVELCRSDFDKRRDMSKQVLLGGKADPGDIRNAFEVGRYVEMLRGVNGLREAVSRGLKRRGPLQDVFRALAKTDRTKANLSEDFLQAIKSAIEDFDGLS